MKWSNLTNGAFQLQAHQLVHLRPEFVRQFIEHVPAEAGDHGGHGFLIVDTSLLEIEQLIFTDFGCRGFVFDPGCGVFRLLTQQEGQNLLKLQICMWKWLTLWKLNSLNTKYHHSSNNLNSAKFPFFSSWMTVSCFKKFPPKSVWIIKSQEETHLSYLCGQIFESSTNYALVFKFWYKLSIFSIKGSCY